MSIFKRKSKVASVTVTPEELLLVVAQQIAFIEAIGIPEHQDRLKDGISKVEADPEFIIEFMDLVNNIMGELPPDLTGPMENLYLKID